MRKLYCSQYILGLDFLEKFAVELAWSLDFPAKTNKCFGGLTSTKSKNYHLFWESKTS